MGLKAFRFRYDELLEQCFAGEHLMAVLNPAGPFEEGRHVRKIQQALLDLSYPLPSHGADSVYGPEVASAVSQFKTDQGIFPNDGVVGPRTMATLDSIFLDEVPFPVPVPGPGDMSLDDFIEAMQAAEQANSGDTQDQFITRVRQLYYPGTDPDGLSVREAGFDQMLPNAPFKLADGSRRLLTAANMDPIFFARLSMRAPENPVPGRPLDNPSPYFFDATGERVDLGHLLLTIDALRHPGAGAPYTDFGIPEIDPASWVGDLGIALVWTELDGLPDAPRQLPPLPSGNKDLDGYYAMSAPEPDLRGDIDGFNIAQLLPASSFSAALISYYVDGDVSPGLYRKRYRQFLSTLFGTDDPDSPELIAGISTWTPRVDRFNDLYAFGPIKALLFPTPPPRQWPFTSDVIATFFQWLLDQAALERQRFD
jgi:peptidoglycan hydrolase-like protein with peptidoglycan-binding domain